MREHAARAKIMSQSQTAVLFVAPRQPAAQTTFQSRRTWQKGPEIFWGVAFSSFQGQHQIGNSLMVWIRVFLGFVEKLVS